MGVEGVEGEIGKGGFEEVIGFDLAMVVVVVVVVVVMRLCGRGGKIIRA